MHRLCVSILALLLAAQVLVGCVAREPAELPAPPPPPTPQVLLEENMPVVEKPQVRITDIKDALTDDKTEFIVTGLLTNDGNGPTTSIVLQVEGHDMDEKVIETADGIVSTQVIQAHETATFTSRLKRRSDVVSYHVEAAIK